MKHLTIYIFIVFTLFSCEKEAYPEDEYIPFRQKDTALIPYVGNDTLQFIRWDISDTSIYDTITLIGQGREYYNNLIGDFWKGENVYGVWGEAVKIHFDAYTSYRKPDQDIELAYETIEYETKLKVTHYNNQFNAPFGPSFCTIGDTVVNGNIYADVMVFGMEGCINYETYHKTKLTIYYNKQYGILRLINSEWGMIWELIP